MDKSDIIKSKGRSGEVCSIECGVTGTAELPIDDDDHEYWIYRMMIDQKHQGKGYGKEAVQLVIADIRTMKEPHHQTISLSYEPDNEHAKRIYEKIGFREIDGLVIEGEQVARYVY